MIAYTWYPSNENKDQSMLSPSDDITSVEVGLLDLSIPVPTHDAIGPSFLDTPWKCWMGRDLPLQK